MFHLRWRETATRSSTRHGRPCVSVLPLVVGVLVNGALCDTRSYCSDIAGHGRDGAHHPLPP
eukprot:SAG11_NODE_4711_length_1796_cov_1.532705_4_plen_61_part_01